MFLNEINEEINLNEQENIKILLSDIALLNNISEKLRYFIHTKKINSPVNTAEWISCVVIEANVSIQKESLERLYEILERYNADIFLSVGTKTEREKLASEYLTKVGKKRFLLIIEDEKIGLYIKNNEIKTKDQETAKAVETILEKIGKIATK